MEDLNVVFGLVAECKYLAAREAYQKLNNKLKHNKSLYESDFVTVEQSVCIKELLNEHSDKIIEMLTRAEEVQITLDFKDTCTDWILGANYYGITTHYMKSPENPAQIVVKMEGVLEDLPLFEQLAVIHEIDLFQDWAPMCQESKTVEKISAADMIAYINLGLPFLSRDTAVRAYGADCLETHGKIIIQGQSINDCYEGDKKIPFKPVNWRHNKLVFEDFKCVFDVQSPTSAKASVIARVDMNSALPQTIINFLMRNLAGILLHKYQKQVMKVSSRPTCPHAERIRNNKDFYVNWLLPKLRAFCDFKGWEQPTISSLGPDGIPPVKPLKAFSEDDETGEDSPSGPQDINFTFDLCTISEK